MRNIARSALLLLGSAGAALPAVAAGPVDFTGIWAAELRYHDVGFPLVLRNTEWAPLSEGRPESRQAPGFDEQAAKWLALVEQDQDLVAYYAANTYRPPLTDAGQAAAQAQRAAAMSRTDRSPTDSCLPGVTIGISGYGIGMEGPLQLMQSADRLLILFEDGTYRTVFLDGRGHEQSLPSWTGHSVGRWESDTLVVSTANFQGETTGPWPMLWPMSAEAKVTETFSLSDAGRLLTVKLVYEDPVNLKGPLARMIYLDQRSDYELIPSSCLENVQGIAEYDAVIGNQ